MAKCLKNKNTGEIKRFSEKSNKEIYDIISMVNLGDWQYVAKSEWKKVRPEPKKSKKKTDK